MFGNLFDEKKTPSVMTSIHTFNTSIPCPPLPRHALGLSGIDNPGSTCYLNSLLQTLLFTPEFREGLFGLTDSELGSIEDKNGKVRIIPLQLQKLFVRLLLIDQQAASTSELTDSFRWTEEEKRQQHDVQELNKTLFSAIESSLRGTSGSNLISKLYHGSTVTEIVCQMCGKISEKEEDFLDLNVVVGSFSSLQDSLSATFRQKETMKGKNQYRCSTCCNLVDAKKGIKIRKLPPILTLSLVRFAYDIGKGERFKECGRLAFPMEIDMEPYCDKILDPEESIYELFSVLIHSGSCYGGHYHAYIKDVDCLGTWSIPVDEPSVKPSASGSSWDEFEDPIELIKYLMLQQDEHFCSIEQLCKEISKYTGSSWNKSYKKDYGALCKFLQKQNHVFYLDSTTSIVYLLTTVEEGPKVDNVVQETNTTIVLEEGQSSPKEGRKSTTKNSLKLNFFDKKKLRSTICEEDQSWFDFNDSRVSPICTKDIEKQYGGKESAYMLFFRAKSLKRLPEAKKNPSYMIPQRFLNFAKEENSKLTKQRELYQLTLNTIHIQIYFSCNYSYVNGALQQNSESVMPSELSIDRRKCLTELKQEILALYKTHVADGPIPDLTLYIAQDLPAGFHLCEQVNPSKETQTLSEISILEGTKIFVCDNAQINGCDILVGAAYEPVLLNISAAFSSGEIAEVSRGFRKSMTLSEIKSTLSEAWGFPVEDILINKMDHQGNCTRIMPITEDQLKQSLSDLDFVDGDVIVLESISCKRRNLDSDKDMLNILARVENITSNCQNGEVEGSSSIEMEIHSETTVGELKALILSKKFADMSKEYLLRKYSEGPPLHEHLSVKCSGLIEMNTVFVEEGRPPTEEEISLKFSIKGGAGDQPSLEMNFEKKTTVQQCLNKIMTLAGLRGESWYLQKMSWCGEPLETLYSDTHSLEDEGVRHGDILILGHGSVFPKGFMTYTIWLYPTLRNLLAPQSTMNGILGDYENLYRSIINVAEREFDFVKLGEIEISSDSSIADLKKQILTLPLLSRVSLPNLRFLRLRLVDNNKPGKVLRGLTEPLKKLKLNSHPSLCIQLLPFEEDLTQNHILLHVRRRISETKTYSTPLEIAWDTTKSASSKALKQIISEKIGIPMSRLVIAKHFSDRFFWSTIEESANQKKANKNRWMAKKQNLRYSPYFLRDGDTIGVKDQLTDPNKDEDFNTQEDLEKQEILRIAGEGKRIKRQNRNTNGSGDLMLGGSDCENSKTTTRSEVGITIHVDDFI